MARFAHSELRRRQAKAADAVRMGQLHEYQATQKLRPWAAIACLAGADVPELEEMLAEQRVVNTDGEPVHSEAELRACIAHDLCPRAVWLPVLAKARDRALDAASPHAPAPNAASLQALCAALGVTAPYLPTPPRDGEVAAHSADGGVSTSQQRTAA